MSIFSRLFGAHAEASSTPVHVINPVSGLPMVDDCIDVAGNVFGTDAQECGFHSLHGAGSDICMSDDIVSPFTDDF